MQRTGRAWLSLIVSALSWSPALAQVQVAYEADPLEARVWLDRGDEPVLAAGEGVRVYYRASEDSYVAIFRIDTNGSVQLLYPRSPDEDHYVRGGRDYRLLFPASPYWLVDDLPGLGYFFIVATPEPFDFSSMAYSYYDRGWDLTLVGRQVYRDPYVAMDDYVAALVPDWGYASYALDFVSYHVQEHYDYPRFLCYDCHGFQTYYAWNPYLYTCTSFRVVIYDDPYYYPSTRYRGRAVVYVRPPQPFRPRYVLRQRRPGESGALLVTERPTSTVGSPGEVPRRSTAGIGSGGEDPGAATTGDGVARRYGNDAMGVDPSGVQGTEPVRAPVPGTVTTGGTRPLVQGRPTLERRSPTVGETRRARPPAAVVPSAPRRPRVPAPRSATPGADAEPPRGISPPGSAARPGGSSRPSSSPVGRPGGAAAGPSGGSGSVREGRDGANGDRRDGFVSLTELARRTRDAATAAASSIERRLTGPRGRVIDGSNSPTTNGRGVEIILGGRSRGSGRPSTTRSAPAPSGVRGSRPGSGESRPPSRAAPSARATPGARGAAQPARPNLRSRGTRPSVPPRARPQPQRPSPVRASPPRSGGSASPSPPPSARRPSPAVRSRGSSSTGPPVVRRGPARSSRPPPGRPRGG